MNNIAPLLPLRLLQATLASVGTAAIVYSGSAAEFNYGLGYTAEYTTNINAAPRGREQDEWYNAVLARIGYADNTDTLVARLTTEVQYRDYVHDRANDETLYAVDGSAIWTLWPGLLTWTVEDSARQVRLNPTGPDAPANRAAANVFRTGPDAYFHVSRLHTLSVGARYTNLYVGESDVDNQAYSGVVRWLYQSTPQTTWSMNAERQRVEFDNRALNDNYVRNDAYLQVNNHFAQSQLVLLGGATSIDRDRGTDVRGSLARLSWSHNISSTSVFGLSASVGYQDTSFQLLSEVSAPTDPLTPIAAGSIGTDAVSADFYYNRAADMFYTLRGSRTEYRFRIHRADLDFQTTPQDRKEAGARFEFNYLYSATSTIGVFGDYLKTRFQSIRRDDEDTEFGARYGYRISRNTTLGLEARRHQRSSTDPTAEYIDNRYLFTILYSTEPLRLPTAQP